jgi:hypothetical protein
MSPESEVAGWLERIDSVQRRLAAVAVPREGLTEADPDTGERWEAGQVWGHLAEFIQYWLEQAGDVIDAFHGEPVAFGRPRNDPARAAGIEQGKSAPLSLLTGAVHSDLETLRTFLHALPEGWQNAVGLHPRLGPIAAPRILEDFLVSHLEEHVTQLENLRDAGG